MLNSLRLLVVVGVASALGLGVLACSGGVVLSDPGAAGQPPVKEADVTVPGSGIKIAATISAVTLGEECANAGGGAQSATCSNTPPSTLLPDGGFAPPPGGCGSYSAACQASNVQIAFTASGGNAGATIEIVSVTLLDATGALVDTLKASAPQSWNGGTYATWDQTVPPASELKASYTLTSPAWSTISSADSSRTYSTAYTLDVTLRIGGIEVTLESAAVTREPPVST